MRRHETHVVNVAKRVDRLFLLVGELFDPSSVPTSLPWWACRGWGSERREWNELRAKEKRGPIA